MRRSETEVGWREAEGASQKQKQTDRSFEVFFKDEIEREYCIKIQTVNGERSLVSFRIHD